PASVAIRDLNGDGRPDIVTANNRSNTETGRAGSGDGVFRANAQFATGDSPQSVAIADLNGDGRQDLVTANQGYRGNTVSVLLRNGDGTFGAQTEFATGDPPASVAIRDLNGDGRPDIVTANNRSNT